MKSSKILVAGEQTNEALIKAFKGDNRKLAKECLELCQEWAMVNKSTIDEKDKRTSKKECKAYVKENLEPAGSAFLSIIMGILVRMIVSWIVNNFINNLKN